MEVKVLKYAQFQYGYRNRIDIEKTDINEFKYYLSKNQSKDNSSYILYNDKLFEANFNKDTGIVRLDRNIYDTNEKQNIIDKYEEQTFKVEKIEKNYNGFNLSSLDCVMKKEINIQSEENGFYIEPEIIIENNKATIKYEDETIGKVNDARSITLLNAINRYKDVVVVKRNKLKIYTFKSVSKSDDYLKIRIFEDDEKRYKQIVRQIKDGCRLKNNEIWLFLSDDINDVTTNSMILILPDKAWCKCVLDGNELKIKQVIQKPRNIRGKNFLVKRNLNHVEFERNKSIEDELVDNDGFNDVVATKSKNINFLEMIKSYEETEKNILEENKKNCPNIKYKSSYNDTFVIADENIDYLEKWQNKKGMTVCFKDKMRDSLIGNLKEVGDDYIKIDFKDDMTRNAIPRNSGTLGINFNGEEVIHKRREKAIELLTNDSAAISHLAQILDGTKDLELFLYDRLLEKYEI